MMVGEEMLFLAQRGHHKNVGSILLVEDDPSVLRLVSYILEKEGYHVTTALDGEKGWACVLENDFDLIITDIRMPGMDGLELLSKILLRFPKKLVLVLSAFGNKEVALHALKLGAYDYLKKPLDNQRLRAVVKHLLNRDRELDEGEATPTNLGLSGRSHAMKQLRATIRRIAGYHTPVLVLGEPGVGKRRVARAIHGASPWSGGPFELFDCASTTSTSAEALFWGVPGAIHVDEPDANIGILERARGGTVLLAELGHLSKGSQQQVLRSLKSESVRVGVPRHKDKSRVRFISTTHTAIRSSVEEGLFSEDLMYRLRGVVIEVPPLRERPEDIRGLAFTFAKEIGVPEPETWITDEVIERFERYQWPKNARELSQVISQLYATVPDRALKRTDLGVHFEGVNVIDQ